MVARIVALVEEASATRAKTQLFIEKLEQCCLIGVVAVRPAPLRRATGVRCGVRADAESWRCVLVKSAVALEELG